MILLVATFGAGVAPASSPVAREFATTARALAGLRQGAPMTCISLSRSRTSRYLDRDTIAYQDTSRGYYVNRTNGGCNFDEDSFVVSVTPSDQLCRGDIIRLVDRSSGMPRGSCSLGDFVPYTR